MYTVKNRLDQGVGLFLAELDARGITNDVSGLITTVTLSQGIFSQTMIIYFADNGIPWAMAKTNLYVMLTSVKRSCNAL
jgi:hypothetical protein